MWNYPPRPPGRLFSESMGVFYERYKSNGELIVALREDLALPYLHDHHRPTIEAEIAWREGVEAAEGRASPRQSATSASGTSAWDKVLAQVNGRRRAAQAGEGGANSWENAIARANAKAPAGAVSPARVLPSAFDN